MNFDHLFAGTPAFDHRSYMLDVSRDRVPTNETLRWLVDVLAALRYTELQLYTEHTYAFEGHEEVWEHASPLTQEELRDLRSYSAAAGVELVSNLNTFGHMERWLKHDSYRHRAECPDGLPEAFRWLPGPGCLAPTEDNADFALKLARDLSSVIGSRRIMIGGDEPFELGHGRSVERASEEGRTAVYLDHLGRIVAPLIEDGHEVLFWGDQFRLDPQAAAWIPDGSTCVVWHYEAPSRAEEARDSLPAALLEALGMPADWHVGFESHARLVLDSGASTWLACGTSTWNTLLGRTANAAGNINDAATVGAAGGARGLMLTDWGDNGHHQPLAVSLPAIVRAGVAGWAGRPVDESVDVDAAVDLLLGAPPGTGELLADLGRISETLGTSVFNGSVVFNALVPIGRRSPDPLDRDAAHASIELLQQAREWFGRDADETSRWGIAAQELDAVCWLAEIGLHRLLDDDRAEDLADATSAQRAAWLRSSRPGGLDDSLARLI